MSSPPTKLISRVLPGSLGARLVLLVVIAVIPAVGLVLYTARDQRRMAERHAETDLRRLSQVVDNEHRFLIEGARQLLSVLAELPAVRNHDGKACSETMRRVAREYPQYVGLGAIRPNGDSFCEVSDTGIGIPPEFDVFELFTTTKPSRLGLGLAIARQIVAAHGGVISCESTPGRGTVFRITIPAETELQRSPDCGAPACAP